MRLKGTDASKPVTVENVSQRIKQTYVNSEFKMWGLRCRIFIVHWRSRECQAGLSRRRRPKIQLKREEVGNILECELQETLISPQQNTETRDLWGISTYPIQILSVLKGTNE